jgi:hypothetical protein
MIDWNKPIQLNGQPCKVIYTFKDGRRFVVSEDQSCSLSVGPDGRACGYQIINTPPPKRNGVLWVIVWPDFAAAYQSKTEADSHTARRQIQCLACIQVHWQEGQGIEWSQGPAL